MPTTQNPLAADGPAADIELQEAGPFPLTLKDMFTNSYVVEARPGMPVHEVKELVRVVKKEEAEGKLAAAREGLAQLEAARAQAKPEREAAFVDVDAPAEAEPACLALAELLLMLRQLDLVLHLRRQRRARRPRPTVPRAGRARRQVLVVGVLARGVPDAELRLEREEEAVLRAAEGCRPGLAPALTREGAEQAAVRVSAEDNRGACSGQHDAETRPRKNAEHAVG